jgi:hypothetical protein
MQQSRPEQGTSLSRATLRNLSPSAKRETELKTSTLQVQRLEIDAQGHTVQVALTKDG